MRNTNVIIFLIISTLLMSSCKTTKDVSNSSVIQKRKYNKGIFVNNKSKIKIKKDTRTIFKEYNKTNVSHNIVKVNIKNIKVNNILKVDKSSFIACRDSIPIIKYKRKNNIVLFIKDNIHSLFKKTKNNDIEEEENPKYHFTAYIGMIVGIISAIALIIGYVSFMFIPWTYIPVAVVFSLVTLTFSSIIYSLSLIINIILNIVKPEKYKIKNLLLIIPMILIVLSLLLLITALMIM